MEGGMEGRQVSRSPPMNEVRVEAAGPARRETLENLMQLYLYDMSAYEDGPLNERGRFPVGPDIDAYGSEAGRYPFLIWRGDEPVGFALVRRIDADTFAIAEFFVRRGRRRSGIGARAARALFDAFRGTWRVAELERNAPAQRFWRRVIGDYTCGRFTQTWSPARPKGPMQVFSNRATG